MRKKVFLAVISILAAMVIVNTTAAFAATSTQLTSNQHSSYSWVGLKCYTIGVKGWYDTNGTKIVKYGKTTPIVQTYAVWGAKDKKSFWTSKLTYSGECYGEAYFGEGLVTSWFSLTIEALTDSEIAGAYP